MAVWCFVVALLVLSLSANDASAQSPWLPRVRLDNDAYNFWLQPARRPDEEYTNGVMLTVETARAPFWGRRFAPASRDCAEFVREERPCLATAITFGQDLYTPRLDRAPYQAPDWEAERPYFAWLYLTGRARIVGARSQRVVELSLGVTGPPAGGALAQKVAHTINREFTRRATGWETQVGFEPGVLLRYRHAAIAARLGGASGLGVDVAPAAGIAMGNILTSADAGGVARVGWNLSHPWDPREWTGRRAVEAWISGGARMEYVAHNISLDGNTVRPTRQVERVPGVSEFELGAGLRFQRLSLGYRAVTRGREYRTGPSRHTYSSMIAGIEAR